MERHSNTFRGPAVTSAHWGVLLSTLNIKPGADDTPFESVLAGKSQGLRVGSKGGQFFMFCGGKSIIPKITKVKIAT